MRWVAFSWWLLWGCLACESCATLILLWGVHWWRRQWEEVSEQYAHALDMIAYLKDEPEERDGASGQWPSGASVALQPMRARSSEGLVPAGGGGCSGPHVTPEPLSDVPQGGGQCAPGAPKGGGCIGPFDWADAAALDQTARSLRAVRPPTAPHFVPRRPPDPDREGG